MKLIYISILFYILLSFLIFSINILVISEYKNILVIIFNILGI